MLRVVFMGTPEFAVPALEAVNSHHHVVAVYTQPDRPVGRGLELKPTPVKSKALALGLTVFQPERLTLPGEFERLRGLDPEIIVVVAYGQILRREVLELPRLGCVNIHSSLLPRWRGAAPIQWAILEGDSETGVTTMRLVEKLDAGEILLQARTQIGHEDSAGTLHDRLSRMGAELVIPTLDGLERGTINGLTQDESKVTYASKLSKDMEWLAPALGAEALERRIQALNPWPGTSVRVAFAGVEPRRLRIRGAKARPDIQGQVGQIFEKAGMVLFGTASGALELLSFQWDGKREVDAAGFLHGLRGRGIMLPLETVFELPRSVGS